MSYHIPVLLKETVDGLNVQKDKKYIDATLGGGGHSLEIIKQGGIVLGIDQDQSAIDYVQENLKSEIKSSKLVVAKGNFRDLKFIAKANGFEKVDGVLFDLGVSSYQIDDSGRGFSFRREEPLDMRMNQNQEVQAYEIINKWSEEALIEIISKYGEEVKAAEIAAAIVAARSEGEINTSAQLSEIIMRVARNNGEIHPATRTFQAIRIAVNNETESLKVGLEQAFEILKSRGRISVISFHSLEDRIAKLYFLSRTNENLAKVINKKPIIAEFEETKKNRRSRSAKLRIIEKI